MPHRGLICARKRRVGDYSILKECRDMLGVETFRDITPRIKDLIKENIHLKKKLRGIESEFGTKKVGNVRMIHPRYHTGRRGALYFNKQLIGTKVIIWRKR